MITKWYKEILKYLPISMQNMTYGPQIKTINGTTVHVFSRGTTSNLPWLEKNFYLDASYSSYSNGFRVGTGTTPPTEQDYSLESVITSGLSGSVNGSSNRNADGNVDTMFQITLSNTSSAAITVGEIGYYGAQWGYATEGGASSNHSVMYHRAVLNSPVTINPGESAIINFHVTAVESSAS